MGIDYDVELIFGTGICNFGLEVLENIKKVDDTFIYELEDEDGDLDLYQCEQTINKWLGAKHPNFRIVSPGPYYDCPPKERSFYLTYTIENDMDLSVLRDFCSKVSVEEFQKVYDLLTGETNGIPKLSALPNIW